jgi:putative endopeptidase
MHSVYMRSAFRRDRACLLPVAAMVSVAVSASAQAQKSSRPTSVVPIELKVVEPKFMDTTVNACTDFFQFANGGWLKHDLIPPEYSSTGVSRDMQDRNEIVVRSVLDDVMKRRASLPEGSTPRKLGIFYGSCMDSAAAEKAGIAPIRPQLQAIDRLTSRDKLIDEIAALQMTGHDALFQYFPYVDAHDASRYIATLFQGGLGLPDRDYYLATDASSDSTRRAYLVHITKMFTMAGIPAASASRDAQRVLAVETQLAGAAMPRVEMRDPKATDHPMDTEKLQSLVPRVDWTHYFRAVGISAPVTKVNVAQPAFFSRVDTLLATAPMEDWRAYLRFHVLSFAAPWLSSPFAKESFAFRSRFTGATKMLPRWKSCLREADRDLGEALGEAYVARSFPPESRRRAKMVIDDIRAAFGERLRHLGWMSDTTRAQALDKLARMSEKVGYPEKWRDYSGLSAVEGPFVLNVARAFAFQWRRTAQRPGNPVDTSEWNISVPTVNAYYDASKNEMVFPAGALVPQTFDPKADDGANYGSLGGSWAGHELTHGFDDEGRHYDAAGNLRDWWQPADSTHFSEQAALIVQQYNGYIQVDTFHVNGALTEGENIADYGGLLTGYDALQRALERNGRPALIDGFTPEQRYFLAFAQSFRGNWRDASLRSRVKVDPHAPDRWRVNGPVSNSTAFARAFGCKPGDPMVKPRELVPDIW